MELMLTKLLTYGTLCRGMSNHHYLDGAKFLGEAFTKDKLPMVVAGIPYLFNIPGKGRQVHGEVFEVDDEQLARIDRLEGHPNWYRRQPVTVTLNGKLEQVEAYFCQDKLDEAVKKSERIFVSRFVGV